MIVYKRGNIFDSKMETLVNPVNCVGVMGKGLALEFKRRYPDMYVFYKGLCNKGLIYPGKVIVSLETDHNILLFPTKDHWRSKSELKYIEIGLQDVIREQLELESIAFPRLGCGLGGLDWRQVKPLMEKYLQDFPYEVEIYE